MSPRAWPLLLSLLAASAAFTLGYVGNEDFWWYLASGDAILERLAIPQQDPFLYTSSEQATWVTSSLVQRTWVAHSWLWTVLLALLDRAFGLEGVALFSTLCVASLVVLIFTRAKLDRFGLANASLTALALFASADRFTPRTDLVSGLLLVVFLVVLERSRPLGWRSLALLAGLQWLWSNLHGGFPLGIAAAGAHALGDGLHELRTRRRAAPRGPGEPAPASALPLLCLVPLLCLASLATPTLGLERLRLAIGFAQQLAGVTAGAAQSPILEWQPTYAAGFGPALRHGALLCLGALSFAVARPPRRLSRFLVFSAAALLSVSALRFISVFALATAVVAIANLGELHPALAARLAFFRRPWARALQALAAAAGCALLLATAHALWTSRDALDGGGPEDGFVSVRPESSAPGAAAYIRAHDLPGPIFNEIALGGYLIHALHPERQLFIDTRNLSSAVLADYRRAVSRPAAWRALLSRYGFRTVVLSNLPFTPLPLRSLLVRDPQWRLVFVDPQASVFVRPEQGPPPPEIAAFGRWGEGAVPFLPPAGPGPQRWMRDFGLSLLKNYLQALAEIEQPEALARIATAALAAEPDDPALLDFRGYAALRLGKPFEAAADYARVVELDPENFRARVNLAQALLRSGRAEEALPQLARARALDPTNPVARRLQERIERLLAARRR